jgi:flagellar hook assembly protein FlgD
VRRLPVAAFVALAILTIAAFFVTQHLKVTTPLIAGFPAPYPSAINPVNGQVCLRRNSKSKLVPVSFRRMKVSFYLLNQADNVNVYIVNNDGDIVRELPGSGVHMAIKKRHPFVWNGREDNGSIAPDGTYDIKVSLIHQGRSVLISNNAGAEPVTVLTVRPRPRITSVTPSTISGSGGSGATVRYTGADGLEGRIFVYRIGSSGTPQLLKSFTAGRGGSSVWDGTASGGRPAPPGTYAFRLRVTDKACNVGFYPAQWPVAGGAPPGDRVTLSR